MGKPLFAVSLLLAMMPALPGFAASVSIQAVGARIPVSDRSIGIQNLPDVAAAGDGRLLAVWHGRRNPDYKDLVVSGRFLSRSGSDGPSFAVSGDGPSYPGAHAQISGDAERGWLVVWEDLGSNDGHQAGVFARFIAPDGSMVSEPYVVPESTQGYQTQPRVAIGSDGRFLVLWADQDFLLFKERVLTRIVEGDGPGSSGELALRDGDPSDSSIRTPELVAALPGGRYAIADRDRYSPLRIIEADGSAGAPLGDRSSPSFGTPLAIASCSDGRLVLVVSWRDDDASEHVGFVWFDANGEPLTSRTDLSEVLVSGGARVAVGTTPNCNAIVSIDARSLLVAADGSILSSPFQTGPYFLSLMHRKPYSSIVAVDESSYFAVFETETNGIDLDIEGQWFCAMFDDDSPCGNATCAGDSDDASPAERIKASDAVYALRAATGLAECADCRCDLNGSGTVTVSDALRILKVSVGQDVQLSCPACGEAPLP